MSSDDSHRYLGWRVVVGDRRSLRRRRWPLAVWGSGLTSVPGGSDRRAGPRPGDQVIRTVVAAESVGWLRHLLADPASLVQVRRVTIIVDSWQPPANGWSGRLGPLRHVLLQRIRTPRKRGGPAVVDVRLRRPTPLRAVVAAALPALEPVRPVPYPASADITALDVLPSWLGAGQNVTALSRDLPGNDDIRAHDIVLTPTGEPEPIVEPDLPADVDSVAPTGTELYGATLAANAAGARTGARSHTVLVDLEQAVAKERYGPFGAAAPRAELIFAGSPDGLGWQIVGPQGAICSGRLDRPWLSEDARNALSEIGVVVCPSVPGRHPLEEAALLVHLVLAGVYVHTPDSLAACRSYLAAEVIDLLRAPLPGRTADDLEWEVRAVRQRRAAMRGHAAGLAVPRLVASSFPALAEPPSVSALLVTKRLEHLAGAIAAIEAQTYPNLEIVLCLHGIDLPARMRAELAACSREVEILNLPADHGFGEAIGEATARARGSLVTKFDDDDTYGSEHVWDLVLARHYSGATLVGKGAEFVHLQTLDITVRRDAGRAEVFAPVVAGGTMLISRGDLEHVGGWRPVPRSIDRGLIDRVRRAGGVLYRTHPLGYVYHRRSAGHTWDPGLEYFLRGGGMQWSGLPRNSEFGTEPVHPGTGPEAPAHHLGTPGRAALLPRG